MSKQDEQEPQVAEAAPDAETVASTAHQTEGGGAWPPELLVERGTVPGQPIDANALYEKQAREAKS